MVIVTYDTNDLLSAKNTFGDTVYTWTYSVFEKYLNEAITPSMYNHMVEYVAINLDDDDMDRLENGDYEQGDLEEMAVSSYFEIPIQKRIKMHEDEVNHIEKLIDGWTKNEEDARWALERPPWNHKSALLFQYRRHFQIVYEKATAMRCRLEGELCEENNWYGGHESNV